MTTFQFIYLIIFISNNFDCIKINEINSLLLDAYFINYIVTLGSLTGCIEKFKDFYGLDFICQTD